VHRHTPGAVRAVLLAAVAALAGLGTFPAAGAVIRVTSSPGPAFSPSPGAGRRPGPDLLYAPPAAAPQLSNSGVWRAAPILVSGASAYRGGEFLYQDFLYDDHGARQAADPADRRTNNSFSATSGTYTYPSDRRYAENAADLVEIRVKPLPDSTAVRVTLNTMTGPSLIGISVALGGTAGVVHDFPFGANTRAPAQRFVTVHPEKGTLVGTLTDAATGAPLAGGLTVRVDLARRQIEFRVPHSAWDPGRQTVRLAAATGLWDTSQNRYLLPRPASSATSPGGAGSATSPSGFFNVAFRAHEGIPHSGLAGLAEDMTASGFWRERGQAAALTHGDISPFAASVDFGKLADRSTDDSAIPTTGGLDRIMASHFETAQGVDYAASCYGGDFRCQYQGRLQPYGIYLPTKPAPPTGYGMTLLLHANAANYNEFLDSRQQSQFGDRSTGSVVLTPQARDPGGGYTGYAGADVFEAWADAARHYHLDPQWNAITGYSLGSLGVFKLGEQFPDLFAKAVAVVGSPYPGLGQQPELVSLRQLPTMIWDVGPVDELNPAPQETALGLDRLGYRYAFLEFPGEHLTPAYNDQFAEAVPFLADTRLQPNPAHVSYAYAKGTLDGLDRPYGDYPALGLTADHAYWLSGLRVRSSGPPCASYAVAGCGGVGTLDAISAGFGLEDPVPSGTRHTTGVQGPGAIFPALPYAQTYQTWAAPRTRPGADRLHLTVTNISAITVDVTRAALDCAAVLEVSTDGPLQVTLAGCHRTEAFGRAPTQTSASVGAPGPAQSTSPKPGQANSSPASGATSNGATTNGSAANGAAASGATSNSAALNGGALAATGLPLPVAVSALVLLAGAYGVRSRIRR